MINAVTAGYHNVPILSYNTVNPLIVPPIRIQIPANLNSDKGSATSSSGQPADNAVHSTPRDQIIERVAICLHGLLRREYGGTEEALDSPNLEVIMQDRNPKLSKLSPDDALKVLNTQILAYSEGKAPFNRSLHEQETPYDWWVKISTDSAASVLGVRSRFNAAFFLGPPSPTK